MRCELRELRRIGNAGIADDPPAARGSGPGAEITVMYGATAERGARVIAASERETGPGCKPQAACDLGIEDAPRVARPSGDPGQERAFHPGGGANLIRPLEAADI